MYQKRRFNLIIIIKSIIRNKISVFVHPVQYCEDFDPRPKYTGSHLQQVRLQRASSYNEAKVVEPVLNIHPNCVESLRQKMSPKTKRNSVTFWDTRPLDKVSSMIRFCVAITGANDLENLETWQYTWTNLGILWFLIKSWENGTKPGKKCRSKTCWFLSRCCNNCLSKLEMEVKFLRTG